MFCTSCFVIKMQTFFTWVTYIVSCLYKAWQRCMYGPCALWPKKKSGHNSNNVDTFEKVWMINLHLNYEIQRGLLIPVSHLDTLVCQRKGNIEGSKFKKKQKKNWTRTNKLKCRASLRKGREKKRNNMDRERGGPVSLHHQENLIKTQGHMWERCQREYREKPLALFYNHSLAR